MTDPHTDLLEMVLRDCGKHTPWYPSEFAASTGVPRPALETCLDQLRMNGLVHLTPWIQGHGQGYQLTPFGAQVLEQPRLLGRLRAGDVPTAPREAATPGPERHAIRGLPAEQIRTALVEPSSAVVTKVMAVLNVAWFVVGLLVFMSRYGGEPMAYFSDRGGDALVLTYEDCGWLNIADVIDHGQWWRLLSCGFLHGGILHLGMNMYCLYVLGPLLEKLWGHAAFAVIYVASCIGGSAFALVFTPDANLVGALGAICGLLGSMITWVYLSRNHLPPHILSAWRSNLIQNVVLLVVISLLPHVSMAGHAGGGFTGAILAAPLWFARFGRGPQRLLGWLAMVALVVVGLCFLYMTLMKFAASPQMDGPPERNALIHQVRKAKIDGDAKPGHR